jgi:hypothetical protein
MITSTTAAMIIALAGSEYTTVGFFLGRRVPDATCYDHLRDDRRLVLGPASPAETATTERYWKIKPSWKAAARNFLAFLDS